MSLPTKMISNFFIIWFNLYSDGKHTGSFKSEMFSIIVSKIMSLVIFSKFS